MAACLCSWFVGVVLCFSRWSLARPSAMFHELSWFSFPLLLLNYPLDIHDYPLYRHLLKGFHLAADEYELVYWGSSHFHGGMGPNYLYHFIPDGISSMLYLRDPPGPFQLRFLLCFLLLLLLRRAAEVLLCGVDREDIWSTHQIPLVYAVFLETAQGASSATIGTWYIIHGSVMIIYMAHLFCGWWAENPRNSCCLIV